MDGKILLLCNSTRRIMVFRRGNLQRLTPLSPNSDLVHWWLLSSKQLRKELRKPFDSLVILVAWILWKERNQRIFQKVKLSVRDTDLSTLIMDEIKVWVQAGIVDFRLLFPTTPQGNALGEAYQIGRTGTLV